MVEDAGLQCQSQLSGNYEPITAPEASNEWSALKLDLYVNLEANLDYTVPCREFQGQGLGIIVWAFAKIGYDPRKIRDLLQAFAQEVCPPPRLVPKWQASCILVFVPLMCPRREGEQGDAAGARTSVRSDALLSSCDACGFQPSRGSIALDAL